MTKQHQLDELFSAWRAEPLPRSLPAPGAEGAAGVAHVLRQVAAKKQRRALVRRAAGWVALAAGVFGVALAGWMNHRANLVESNLAENAAARGAATVVLAESEGEVSITDTAGTLCSSSVLAEGYGVRTQKGSARLGFPSGASTHVSRDSALKLVGMRENEVLFLSRGRVEVEVPKLGPAHGFAVETPDARVVVHGTRFSVSVEGAPPALHTRVSVTRGVVSVQHGGEEVRLTAGQAWPPEPAASAEPQQASEAASEAEVLGDAGTSQGDIRAESPRARRAAQHARASSHESRKLALQNRRFVRAMNLKKQGDAVGALRELQRLLTRYPDSALSQEAHVERLRILRGLGRSADAAREARRYLAEFHDGYAVEEARALLLEHP